MKSILGNYHGAVADILSQKRYPMSFLSDKYGARDVEPWREEARTKVRKLLSFNPPDVPLAPETHDRYVKDGLVYKRVSYAQPYGPRTEGILMYPEGADRGAGGDGGGGRGGADGGAGGGGADGGADGGRVEKLPGVLALHDHGGFKYYGKEKITDPKDKPAIMRAYQEHYYGDRAWASELAKRGYIVFVPDVFLWGSRKMRIEDVKDEYVEETAKYPAGGEAHVLAYNAFASKHEDIIAKSLLEAGTTWPGMMLYDDMRAVDFLLSQPQTDAGNIGCGGLSGGGLRTVFLSAMDERVKCGVCVGFMSTAAEFALYKTFTHTWMMYLPGLTNLMDFPDLYSLHGRKPTMTLYDEDDDLFTPEGQHGADCRLRAIYEKMGVPEMYEGHFYPGPHKFDIEMQQTAFVFYDKWMKAERG